MSDILKITPVSSGESPLGNMQRKRAVCCHTSHFQILYLTPTSSGGREDALQSIILKCSYIVVALPQWESMAGSGGQVK